MILSDEEINQCFESVMFNSEVEPSRELIGRAIEAEIIKRIGEPVAWLKSNGDAVYLNKPDDVFQYEPLFATPKEE